MKIFTEIEESIIMRDRWISTLFRTSNNQECSDFSKKSISFYEEKISQYPLEWIKAVYIVISLRNS